ncbi:MAG: RNA 2',3'-cyclic phosphodiesterase, partial [Desulfobacteraceae bacterium]|nr:RNA 2',3'-cyclic phosphodiesterase [Desulfobacteraceae bacterium]
IPLPESIRQMLGDLQSQLKKEGIQATWPKPAGFHLTLKFLGITSLDTLMQIQAVMDQFCGKYPDLLLTAGSMGVFPDIKKARVVWTDIRGQTRRLEQLFTQLDGALHALGFSGQSRPFSPHITLARIKTPVPSRKLVSVMEICKETWSDEFHAQCMNLYKSRLTSAGAIHTRLFQVKL